MSEAKHTLTTNTDVPVQVKDILAKHLQHYADFPQKGVTFTDIFPILRDPIATEALINTFLAHIFTVVLPRLENKKIDMVVGLDARGFLLGPLIALRLGAGFAPVRKAGKLPGTVIQAAYVKEYGTDMFEMQNDALQKGQNVLIVDDLIATGGSAYAAGELVAQSGATVVENLFIIEIGFLKGREKLKSPTWALILEEEEAPEGHP